MNKISIVFSVIFLTFLVSPVFASAADCPVGASCSLYNDGNMNGICKEGETGSYCGLIGVVSDPSKSTADAGSVSKTQFVQSGSINMQYLLGYKTGISGVINNILVPVLIAIAFLVFVWGIYKAFIQNAASESEKGEGRKFAMWGVIGFVLIFSLWGLVNIVRQTLNFEQAGSTAPAPPKI